MTDIEVGPDGLLYIVSLSEGTIYRMVPKTMMITMAEPVHTQPSTFPIEYAAYTMTAGLIIVGIVIYLAKIKRKSK